MVFGIRYCGVGATSPGITASLRFPPRSIDLWSGLRDQGTGTITLAKLYFSYSAMNAGKSTLLLQASSNYRERGMRTVLPIAALDERAGKGRIGARIGLKADVIPFGQADDPYALVQREKAGHETPVSSSTRPSS